MRLCEVLFNSLSKFGSELSETCSLISWHIPICLILLVALVGYIYVHYVAYNFFLPHLLKDLYFMWNLMCEPANHFDVWFIL